MSKEYYTEGTNITVWDSLEITDPDSVAVTIKDPNGNIVVNGAAMALSSAGKYYHKYQSHAGDPLGEYTVITSVMKAGETSVVRNTFTLQAQ